MIKGTVLIAGAGPTGLVAALECRRLGLSPILFERNAGPTDESRAVGVNRQSLQLLAPSGAAERILARGVVVRAARLFDEGRLLGRFRLPEARSGPPALVALPQSETERAMVAALEEAGVCPRWETPVAAFEQDEGGVTVALETGERVRGDYCLAADGSHSLARRMLGLSFPGERYPETWSLLDAELDWPYPEDQAAVFLDRGGGVLFVITLGEGRFRAISNRPDAEARLKTHFDMGAAFWANDFTVSLRAVERYGQGRIWIAGDAAHVHSPAGGQGMNLGIEDACDFAASLAEPGFAGDLGAFEARRKRAAARVLRVSDWGYRAASLSHPVGRVVRNFLFRAVAGSDRLRTALARLVFRTDAQRR